MKKVKIRVSLNDEPIDPEEWKIRNFLWNMGGKNMPVKEFEQYVKGLKDVAEKNKSK